MFRGMYNGGRGVCRVRLNRFIATNGAKPLCIGAVMSCPRAHGPFCFRPCSRVGDLIRPMFCPGSALACSI